MSAVLVSHSTSSSQSKFKIRLATYFKKMSESLSKFNEDGYTDLHMAAINNDISHMTDLLSMGADVNVKSRDKETPLHCAANYNEGDSHYSVIELLLKSGADVDAEDKYEETPLHMLLPGSDLKTVQLFMDYKANVNIKDNHGETPLFNCVINGNIDTVQLLLDHGSDTKKVSKIGLSVLQKLCIFNPDLKFIKCLLKNGASPNAQKFEDPLNVLYL